MGDIAKRSKNEVQEYGFMEDLAGQGYEGMTQEDFSQAFVGILQPLSPQCMEDNDTYVEGAKPGLFFNRAINFVYGKSIDVIPLYYRHDWTEWKPERGGFAGRHDPESIVVDKSDYSSWKKGMPVPLVEGKDPRNLINDTYTFYCFLPEYPEHGIVILSFTSTNIKPAKNFNTLINMVRTPGGKQAPFFSSVWRLSTTKRNDGKNTWYTIGESKANAERLRYITADEYNNLIKPLIEMARAMEADYSKSQDMDERDVTPQDEDAPY